MNYNRRIISVDAFHIDPNITDKGPMK